MRLPNPIQRFLLSILIFGIEIILALSITPVFYGGRSITQQAAVAPATSIADYIVAWGCLALLYYTAWMLTRLFVHNRRIPAIR